MNKSLLEAVCNFDRQVLDKAPTRAANTITDSCSVTSYLEGPKGRRPEVRGTGTPEDIRRIACSLFAMNRSDRRNYLARISDSQRRLLLKEGKRIRERITDSAIDYSPQVCWAIEDIMRGGRQGAKILDGIQETGTLPREVGAWYQSLTRLGAGHPKTRSLERNLGAYNLGTTARRTRIQDDDALDRFLAAGKEEADELGNAVDESIERAADLSEQAQTRLNEAKEELQQQATDFIGSMVESVTAIIPDIVAEQAATKSEEAAEAIVEKADEDLDAEQAAAEETQNDIDAAENVFGIDEDGRPVEDSVSVNVAEDGSVSIAAGKTSVTASDKMVSATLGDVKTTDPAPTEDVDFTETITEEQFNSLEDHLSDSARAVLDSLGTDAPGEVSRAVSTFREWLKSNYAAIKEAPDSTRERLETLVNELNTILGQKGIMLSVDDQNLLYNGTESLVQFNDEGMSIGSLIYTFNNNPTATDTLLRNASDEFGIILRSLEPTASDSADANEDGDDGEEVTDAANDKLYDTIMANIDTLVGQLDEMGAPAKKADKYMRPWFDRLSDAERAELREAVKALPAGRVSDADDSLLSDEAKQEVLNKVNEEVKRRLKESGIEIADDANGKEWMDYWGEGADVAANLRKARTILSDDEWAAVLKVYNETADKMGLPRFTGEDSVDVVVEAGVPELVFANIQNVLSDDELVRFMELIDDDCSESEEEIEVEGEAEEIEDGLLDIGKKALSKAKLKVGDQLQIGNQWATVVKKKLKTFMVKFKNGIYKEYKYPSKMSSVPDQDNAAIMQTEDSAAKVKDGVGAEAERITDLIEKIWGTDKNAYKEAWKNIEVALSADDLQAFEKSVRKTGEFDAEEYPQEIGEHIENDDIDAKFVVEEYIRWDDRDELKTLADKWVREFEVEDAMDPNEDGDKNVSIGWSREELNKRLQAIAKKRPDAPIKEIDDSMTLDEAIEHASEVARTCEGEECREEHQQLCDWLKELQAYKAQSPLPAVRPDIHEGDRNTYDMNHNLDTFSKVRNTREALEEILRIVAKTMGLPDAPTVDQYQNGNLDEKVVVAVSDSTFDMNELDLICPKLYKRKFTDSAWMVDSVEDIEQVFGITIPDSFKGMPAIVSARPIADSVIAGLGGDKKITFPYNEKRSLYVVPFTE